MPWPPVPAKRPISPADLTISIITLLLTMLLGGGAGAMGLFLLAFLDYCPPETCSVEIGLGGHQPGHEPLRVGVADTIGQHPGARVFRIPSSVLDPVDFAGGPVRLSVSGSWRSLGRRSP